MSDFTTIWAEASELLRQRMNADTYDRWMAGIVPVRLKEEDDTAVLGVSNELFCDWLSDNYSDVIAEELELVVGKRLKLEFEAGHLPAPKPEAAKPAEKAANGQASGAAVSLTAASKPSDGVFRSASGFEFNRRFTFDSFVVGDNCKFAYSACKAVVDAPGTTYNPLFLHSSCGLGKSHLMQAIAQEVLSRNPMARVEYVTCEEFSNQFVDAMQHGRLPQFRDRFRDIDFLLLDDVQFLGSKVGFQEEFFHTFNALHTHHKQIVMAADRAPMEIQNLENRLVSRFEWGLTADIQQPDLETRLAILHKKQDAQDIKLSEDVIEFLANHLKSNVRRLEGALLNLVVHARMDNHPVTVEMAEHALASILCEEGSELTIEDIQRKVAEHFNVRLADMTSKRRPASIVLPRMVAMYLARKLTDLSFPVIGERFLKNHATVLHAVNTIEERLEANPDFKRDMALLERKLHG